MPRPPKHRCHPTFSDEDSDLRCIAWYADKDGYARGQISFAKRAKAHIIVIERKLGRSLGVGELCDHGNGDRLDNQRSNLSAVSKQQNSQNRLPRAEHGFRGATKTKAGKWQSQVGHNGKYLYLGVYDTPEQAAAVAAAKRRELGFYGEAVA